MENKQLQNIETLAEDFKACHKLLVALADEERQRIILTMIRMAEVGGLRHGKIAREIQYTKPSLLRHLKVLRDAGLVTFSHRGVKNYYAFNITPEAIDSLSHMLRSFSAVMEHMPSPILEEQLLVDEEELSAEEE